MTSTFHDDSRVLQPSKPLNVVTLPLRGRHLIEASAGTGKTFNITRLYLRLLLEKNLTVQQILVMTFTNAATEEIRGRIAATLREALSFWRQAESNPALVDSAEPVYQKLYRDFPGEAGCARLQAALLELDDAAVFTIHGFCSKVLNQLAFATGTPMNLKLMTDSRPLYLRATQDWIRKVSTHPEQYNALLTQGWHTPDTFLAQFGRAIRSDLAPVLLNDDALALDQKQEEKRQSQLLQEAFTAVRERLLQSEDIIYEALISKKDEQERQREWETLLLWLNQAALVTAPGEISRFINGNRYRKNEQLKTLFEPLKSLIKQVQKVIESLEKDAAGRVEAAPAWRIAAEGIQFIRAHVAQQKRQQGVVDFDDLIRLLASQIHNKKNGLKSQLRELFPVALIDEFQDTDSHQYEILSQVYCAGSEDQVLLMIGDPKQAIYAFRGGDIFTYLQAGRQADYRWMMDTNWRSVEPMVKAYNRLFYGNDISAKPADVFGFGIKYEPVKATAGAKAAKEPLYDPQPDRKALTYTCITVNPDEAAPQKHQLQHQLTLWLSNEIVRLLNEASLGDRRVQPADIAILVRSASEAMIVVRLLRQAGLGAVFLSNKRSLFTSAQAQDLYRLLDGLWHIDDRSRLLACLTSPLLGIPSTDVVKLLQEDDETLWEATLELIQQLRNMWQQRGCMSVILHLLKYHFQPGNEDTERQLTNYLHLAEVLQHAASQAAHPQQLISWLHRQISDPGSADEQVQRLESDARLIQVVTQHGSKGLEYPIVFVPFASDYRDPAKAGNQWLHQYQYFSPQNGQQLQIGPSYSAIERVREEGDAEATRLLYVAITRAAHRCYVGIAPFAKNEKSALARALGVDSSQNWADVIKNLIKEDNSHTAFVEIPHTQSRDLARAPESPMPELVLSAFTGEIKEAWRLYSFSALARQQTVVKHTQREAELAFDEGLFLNPTAEIPVNLFRFNFEKGANAGNLLHDLLEVCDFSAPAWEKQGKEITRRFGLPDDEHSSLFEWLDEVINTPLALPSSASSSTLTMAQLDEQRTLREAEFYFPMQGVQWAELASILMDHRRAVSEKPIPVPHVSSPQLKGMMHGYIDLLFEWEGRFYVADYKSTHLGQDMASYQFEQMCQNNQRHLYDLQYLIYSLAVHRYLQKKIPDYQAEQHFGGVFYLYLRGMHPENSGQEGVFYTQLTPDTLNQLDRAFSAHPEKMEAP